MKVCAVIMAGGKEMRFGPVKKYLGSKTKIRISGREELLLETIMRCDSIISREDVYIVTNIDQKIIFDATLKRKGSKDKYYIPDENFFIEPEPKNTAHCILFAALRLQKKYKNDDVTMCIFPSDHDIPNDKKNKDLFNDTIQKAIDISNTEEKLITIGIKPTFPATGYGYINYNNKDASDSLEVFNFKEKPDEDKAELFLNSKNHLWNSGIFVWKVKKILEEYEKLFDKETFNRFCTINNKFYIDPATEMADWKEAYGKAKARSVDYAILEETDPNNLRVVLGEFNWQDIGKWDALLAVFTNEENILDVDIIGIDISNRTIYSSGKHIYDKSIINEKNSKNNSYIWLHCEEEDKEKVIDILNSSDYKITDFDCEKASSLKKELIKENKEEFSAREKTEGAKEKSSKAEEKKIFIVHGRDNIKHDVARTIEKTGHNVIILDERANNGDTIIEKLEKASNVDYAVILLTPDDVGKLKNSSKLKPRARQNVIAEFGYFAGKLGRKQICVLYVDGVEIPSDFKGITYIELDEKGAWRVGIIKELKEAGFDVRKYYG